MLANVNSRIDGVIKDLTELKSSLQFPQKEIDDLKPLTEQMTKIEKEIGEVPLRQNGVFGKPEPQEQYSY